MFKAFFFDMDGVLLDSMPNHVKAWEETLAQYGIRFTARDCYINEGRTSRDVIMLLARQQGVSIAEDLLEEIYHKKTASYRAKGGGKPMAGVYEVLKHIAAQGAQIWVVTGGGQHDLYEQLEGFFPGIFHRERFITAYDVTQGKPSPEPYLKAWERCGIDKADCCVVENAPLGIQSGKAAEIFTVGVNTGILNKEDLQEAGADQVFSDMKEMLNWLKTGIRS